MEENAGSKKILIYYILETLRRYSDCDHKLSQPNIAKIVEMNYGMTCDRKAVSRNIMALQAAGFDIGTYEENGEGYFLREPEFTEIEVRMLMDSVLASRYIDSNCAKELVDKLANLTTVYYNKRTNYISQAARWVHTDNPYVFLNIELLDEAIDTHRKVRFVYNRYGLDKKLHPRHDYKYEVDPYQIISNNGRYYLIGNYDKHDCVTNFRVDLITDVEVLPIKSIPFDCLPNKCKTLDIAEYAKYAINMYDGEKISAHLRVKAERLGDIIDWFGKDIRIVKEPDGYIDVRVTGTDNGIRTWALQYGRFVEIISPPKLRELVREDIKGMLEKYE